MGVRWDPTDRSFKADPYPTYRALLENEPLHHSPFGPTLVSRYEDCMTIYRHPAASNDWRKSPTGNPPLRANPLRFRSCSWTLRTILVSAGW